MKIAYVFDLIHPYSMGGVEKRTWELARRHVQHGHEVTIFGVKQWDGPNEIYREGVRLKGVCRPLRLYTRNRRSIRQTLLFSSAVLPHLIRERFDIINASIFPYFSCYASKIGSLVHRTALVISWWEIWGDYWYTYLGALGAVGKGIERMSIKLPDRVIVVAEDLKRGLADWGYDSKRVVVIPDGVSCQEFADAPQISEEDRSDVIYVGRLVNYKGLEKLVEAVALLKQRGLAVRTNIVGDGPERSTLAEQIRRAGLEDLIRVWGRVEDSAKVISLMRGSRVFVYPAAPLGGWALTPLEANAAGIPVITTRSGPITRSSDVVQDGYNGFVLPELSANLMANMIDHILSDEPLYLRMRAQSLEFASRFDWDNQAKAVEALYASLIPVLDRSPLGEKA